MLGQNREPNFDEYQSDLAEPYDGEDEEGVDGPRKPHVQLTGQNGNVFNLLSLCARALKREGMYDEAKALAEKVFAAGSYDEALQAMMEYCDVS